MFSLRCVQRGVPVPGGADRHGERPRDDQVCRLHTHRAGRA